MTAIYSDLAGKVVLVTGGATGIGEAIVRRFAQQKSIVVFLDIKAEEGTRLARELSDEGLSAHFLNVDLTDIAALRAGVADARKAHGPINVLVNNAAHDERHRTEDMTPEYWDDRIAINLKHCFFAAQAVLPDMKAAKAGVIVNFSSISWIAGQGGMAAYTASKSGLLGLTRSLARTRLWPRQHQGQRRRARLDHDAASDREMADARGRARADAASVPEAQAGSRRDRKVRGVSRLRRSIRLHVAALRRGWRLDLRVSAAIA